MLASDPRVRALVEQHTGRAMLLEPADLQHVTDQAAVPRPPRSPADLLRPEQAVVSFTGREDLLAELTDWCEDGPVDHGWGQSRVHVRLLTGPGGAGKTRLANELAARMTAHGWVAVRLTTDTNVSCDVLSQVCRPLLVVVDYAETRVDQLYSLLEAVDHDQHTSPVRVLALARSAGEWWTRAAEHPRGQALVTARVTPVPALHHSVQDCTAAYRRAVRDFLTRLQVIHSTAADWTGLLPTLTTPDAIPDLSAEEFDTPLSVQMAALVELLDTTEAPNPPARPPPWKPDCSATSAATGTRRPTAHTATSEATAPDHKPAPWPWPWPASSPPPTATRPPDCWPSCPA